MQRGQSASLWQSEFEAEGFRARVVCSRINWDLRIGYFDVHPIGVGDVKFVTRFVLPPSSYEIKVRVSAQLETPSRSCIAILACSQCKPLLAVLRVGPSTPLVGFLLCPLSMSLQLAFPS